MQKLGTAAFEDHKASAAAAGGAAGSGAPPRDTTGCGHLFLVHGDSARIACDARLVPCDDSGALAPIAATDGGWRVAVSRDDVLQSWAASARAPLLAPAPDAHPYAPDHKATPSSSSSAAPTAYSAYRAFACVGFDASGQSRAPHGARVARLRSSAGPSAANAAVAAAAAAVPAAAPASASNPKFRDCAVPYAVNLMPLSAGLGGAAASGTTTPTAGASAGRAAMAAAAVAKASPPPLDRSPSWYIGAAVQFVETVRAELAHRADAAVAAAATALATAEQQLVDRKGDEASRSAVDTARKTLATARARSQHAFNRFVPLLLIPFRSEYFGGSAHAGAVLPELITALQAAAGRAPAPAVAAANSVSGVASGDGKSAAAPVAASATSASSCSLAVDVALVFGSAADYHAAQFARKLVSPDDAHFGLLGSSLGTDDLRTRLFSEAARLAKLITKKQLVTFIGAGLSMGAGLPDWKSLIDTLAVEAKMTPSEHKALQSFNFLDGARVIANRLQAQGRSLGDVVAGAVRSDWYTLSHGLLASAGPRTECITTNYDQLIEMARKGSGVSIPVIPAQHGTDSNDASAGGCWLLKMHGCVTRPHDIVLSRDHYLEYDASRSALAGIAQSKLITKHICFFGFSLSDDNFFKIIAAVRGATQQRKRQLGTCVMLFTNDMFEELWKHDVNVVRMDDAANPFAHAHAPHNPFGFAGRQLELLLDVVGSHTASTASFLFDSRYQNLLPSVDAQLCALWEKFYSALPKGMEANWTVFSDFRKRMGGATAVVGSSAASSGSATPRRGTGAVAAAAGAMLPPSRGSASSSSSAAALTKPSSGGSDAPPTPKHARSSPTKQITRALAATAVASLQVDVQAAEALPAPQPALQRSVSSMTEPELNVHATRLQQVLRAALLQKRRAQHMRTRMSAAANALQSPKYGRDAASGGPDEDSGDSDADGDDMSTAAPTPGGTAPPSLSTASSTAGDATAMWDGPAAEAEADATAADDDGGENDDKSGGDDDDDGTAGAAAAADATGVSAGGKKASKWVKFQAPGGNTAAAAAGSGAGKPQYKSKREKREEEHRMARQNKELARLKRKNEEKQRVRSSRSALQANTPQKTAFSDAIPRPLGAAAVARNTGDNHLFVLHTDIRRLACDAWLLPAGGIVDPPRYWFYPELPARPSVRSEYTWPVPLDLSDYLTREFPERAALPDVRRVGTMLNYHADRAKPITTASSGTLAQALDGVAKWVMLCHQQFVADPVTAAPPRFGRQRHLFALPVVGTGRGRLRDSTGTVVMALLKFLRRVLRHAEFQFDIALVCRDEPTCLCAQQARYALFSQELDRLLPNESAREQAHAIALEALRGKLALWIGPQIGFLPTDRDKLMALAARANFSDGEMAELSRAHSNRFDGFQLIANRLAAAAAAGAGAGTDAKDDRKHNHSAGTGAGGGDKQLLDAVTEMLATDEVGLTNVLCASLPASEVISLSADTNFESASDDADAHVCVLPYGMEQLRDTDRWVLKLNGCVTRPETLVLTRAQHSAAAAVRAVNASIIEAQLVTRHVLCVNVPSDDSYFRGALNAVGSIVASTAPNRDWHADPICSVVSDEPCELLKHTWPQLRIVTPADWTLPAAPAPVSAVAVPASVGPAAAAPATAAAAAAATTASAGSAAPAAVDHKASVGGPGPVAPASEPTLTAAQQAAAAATRAQATSTDTVRRRAVDRFLDYLGCVICSVKDKPLLDWRFENILSDDERLVQRELRALVLALPVASTTSTAFYTTRLLLRGLGVDDHVLARVLKKADEFGPGASRNSFYLEMVKSAFSRPLNKPRKTDDSDVYDPLQTVVSTSGKSAGKLAAQAAARRAAVAAAAVGSTRKASAPGASTVPGLLSHDTSVAGAQIGIYPRQDYRQKASAQRAAELAHAHAIAMGRKHGFNTPSGATAAAGAGTVGDLKATSAGGAGASGTPAAAGAAAAGSNAAAAAGAGAVAAAAAGAAAGSGGAAAPAKPKKKKANKGRSARADAERAKYLALLNS